MAEHTTKYGWCETEELFKKLQRHVLVTGQTDTLLVELVSRLDDLLDEHEEFLRLSDEHEILEAKCAKLEEKLAALEGYTGVAADFALSGETTWTSK